MRFRFDSPKSWRGELFWLVPAGAGLVMWGLYGLVNVEERYVTLAYLLVLLPLLAALQLPSGEGAAHGLRRTADAVVALLAVVTLGQSVRLALEQRRLSLDQPHAWSSPRMSEAAEGLARLGVEPGDEVACMGTVACLNEEYWARLAGVRVLTEVYNPNPGHLFEQWTGLPNRVEVLSTLRSQRARVLVASFDPGTAGTADDRRSSEAWVRLGTTDFYALPLTLPSQQRLARVDFEDTAEMGGRAPAALPWDPHREGGP